MSKCQESKLYWRALSVQKQPLDSPLRIIKALRKRIANDIANGKSTTGFQLEASSRVDYFDFELSDTQHLQRYGNEDWSEFFAFSEKLYRIEMDLSQCEHVTTYELEWETISPVYS